MYLSQTFFFFFFFFFFAALPLKDFLFICLCRLINAGKSELNEDQAVAVRCVISRHSNTHTTNVNNQTLNKTDEIISNESPDKEQTAVEELKVSDIKLSWNKIYICLISWLLKLCDFLIHFILIFILFLIYQIQVCFTFSF